MQALILASGAGTRLRPLTDHTPKCLVQVSAEATLLDVELQTLSRHGIRDFVITTGHFGEQIEEYVSSNYPDLSVTFVNNPAYATTNCIYSMWLARKAIQDDVVFLTGDLVFDDKVIDQLLAATDENVMYVDPEAALPKKDFKARLSPDGRIIEIGIDVFGGDARLCWPLYRLSRGAWQKWLGRIETYIERAETTVYGEAAFNDIQEEIDLRPLYTTQYCAEVDDLEDLEAVKKHFSLQES
jgi:choline kinase